MIQSTSEPPGEIDKLRSSAGSMAVGLKEEGNITEVLKFGDDRLLMLKAKAAYEIRMADSIDPDRTNPGIPNSQQRILSAGTDSSIVQDVLLNAKRLLREDAFQNIQIGTAMEAALMATQEMLAMERLVVRLKGDYDEVVARYASVKLANGFMIPSIDDYSQTVKNYFNRADHVLQHLHRISRLFFKDFGGPEAFYKRERQAAHFDSDYKPMFEKLVPAWMFVRESRNALEHPSMHKRLILRDFALEPDGTIYPPSIELVHPRFPQPRVLAIDLMDTTVETLRTLFPHWLAYLCSRKASFENWSFKIVSHKEQKVGPNDLGLAYALNVNGAWLPLT